MYRMHLFWGVFVLGRQTHCVRDSLHERAGWVAVGQRVLRRIIPRKRHERSFRFSQSSFSRVRASNFEVFSQLSFSRLRDLFVAIAS